MIYYICIKKRETLTMNNTINLPKQTFYKNTTYTLKNYQTSRLKNIPHKTSQTCSFGSTNPNAIYNNILQGMRYENLSQKQQKIVKVYLDLKDKLGLKILPKLEFSELDSRIGEYSWQNGTITISPNASFEGERGTYEDENIPDYVKKALNEPKTNSVRGILIHELTHFKQSIFIAKKLGLKKYFNLIKNSNEDANEQIDNRNFNSMFYNDVISITPKLSESDDKKATQYIKAYKKRTEAFVKECEILSQIPIYLEAFQPYYEFFEQCLSNKKRQDIEKISQTLQVSDAQKMKIKKCANLLLDASEQHNIFEFDNILEKEAYETTLSQAAIL